MEFLNKIWGVIRDLRTEEILRFFKESQLPELMHTPYFLGTVAVLVLICVLLKWRLMLALLVGIVGFAELLAYTVAHDTSLDSGIGSESLVVFVGGSVVIVAFVIYLLFIKSE